MIRSLNHHKSSTFPQTLQTLSNISSTTKPHYPPARPTHKVELQQVAATCHTVDYHTDARPTHIALSDLSVLFVLLLLFVLSVLSPPQTRRIAARASLEAPTSVATSKCRVAARRLWIPPIIKEGAPLGATTSPPCYPHHRGPKVLALQVTGSCRA